jgi:hypothetical protein
MMPLAAVWRAQSANLNSFRTTMHSVQPRVSGASEHFFGLNNLSDLELCRIWLSIYDLNAR